MNARMRDKAIERVIGRHGVPGINENGKRMIRLCVEQEMVVRDTLFKKKDSCKHMWMRQDGSRVVDRAIMNYAVVPRNVVGSLLDVRVFRRESKGMLNHCLVDKILREGMKENRGKQVECVREIPEVSELDKREKVTSWE